ncbi:hypothetical protein [Actinosynnema sp. NPDC020468]|uniref:Fic family protein n=1 Tax=Actinosynnema sp. NPDC020468 TaxID=3154488 RepID=UPI0033DCA16B
MSTRPVPAGKWLPAPDVPGVPEERRREGAHLPRPLPSDLDLPAATYRLAAETEHVLGRLDEAASRFAPGRALVRATQLRDAHASLSLAGSDLGLIEALASDLLASQQEQTSARTGHANLLKPHVDACEHGLAHVRKGWPVGIDVVAQMCGIATGRPGAGRAELLREGVGWLGRDPADAYLLTPPGAHLVAGLEQWSISARDATDQPRIVKLALLHYQLEVLQPFPTANGYVARRYSMLGLVECGLLRDQYLPLSVALDDGLDEYRRQVRAMVDTRLPHRWVEFYAEGVRDQACSQLALVTSLARKREEFAELLRQGGVVAKVAADLTALPVVNNRAIQERYGVTKKFATLVTRRLVDVGILSSWESRDYSRVFVCYPVLDLLTMHAAAHAQPDRLT